jgi:uncharacterized protein (DUF433 family)
MRIGLCAQHHGKISKGSWLRPPIVTRSIFRASAREKRLFEGTRIGVHDVIGLIINGANVEDVCRSFPDLSHAQVYECLAYLVAAQMREEIPWGTGGRVIVLNFPCT